MRTIKWVAAAAAVLGAASAAQAQMSLPGSFEVSETGAAVYTIPIAVPPGSAGLEPKLTLQYNSRAGNGLLGVGWTLSGLPSIVRCPRTITQDGARGGINYDSNDRFCLEGERLVAITGSYGADGTEYRTEREGFSKIISYGSAGTGPAWFKVWTKAGQILEFGNTMDSRIKAQGKTTARLWAVNKVSDTAGNYFTVTYAEDSANGEYRPTRIDYTGNATASVAPYVSVRFVYETRPTADHLAIYAAGSVILTTQRLTKIQTYAGESLVREYRVAYEQGPTTQRSRIASLASCDASGACLPATIVAYQSEGTFTFSYQANLIAPTMLNGGTAIYFGDFNGDGFTDAMWYDQPSGSNVFHINNGGTGFVAHGNVIQLGWLNGGSGLYLGDWNGDGRTDVMWYDQPSGSQMWHLSNGVVNGALSFTSHGNAIQMTWLNGGTALYVGDWNGDGRSDVMWYDQPSGSQMWHLSNGVANGALTFTPLCTAGASCGMPLALGQIAGGTGLYLGDWNGDGTTDVMWYDRPSGNQKWFVNNGVGGPHPNNATFRTVSFTAYENPISPLWLNGGTGGIYFGDWNADGLTDLVWYDKDTGSTMWHVNNGPAGATLAFTPICTQYTPTYCSLPIGLGTIAGGTALHFGDWTGEGTTDLFWYDQGSGNQKWFTNSGPSGFSASHTNFRLVSFSQTDNVIPAGQMAGGTGVYLGDWNGDGLTDVMRYDRPSGSNHWFVSNRMRADQVSSVTSGSGAVTTVVSQAAGKGPPLYTKDTGTNACAYPCVDLQGPIYVVSEVQSSNGIGGSYRTTYRYVGAKADQSGRGFLGFRQVIAKDEQTLVEQATDYLQAWPFVGLTAKRTKMLGAVELNRTENTYASDDLGSGRKFVKLTQSVESSKELTGTALPTVTTMYQYDAHGNATNVVVSTGDGHSKTTVNTYTNDLTNWLLGRLTRAEVTAITP